MRQNYNFNMPPVVMNLLIINALVYVATHFLPGGDKLFYNLALFFPSSQYFRIWQPLTHMFVQDGFFHLFTNMFTLWMFGRIVEHDMGSKRFLVYYLVCGLGAALIQFGVNYFEAVHLLNAGNLQMAAIALNTPMVGASGAVYGLLLAFGLMHANAMIMLLFPPIPMKAKWFVIIFGALELLGGIRGGDNIAHFAHLGGMLWGFMLLYYWKKRRKIFY